MTKADLRLYRRMRGIFWGLLLIGIIVLPVVLVLAITVPAQLELYPDAFVRDNGSPGEVLDAGFALAGVLGSIGAVVLGATAGAVDYQRGVLRDLVLASKPRWRIALGRLLAASTWLIGAVLVSYAITVVLGLLLAPLDTSIDWEQQARNALQYAPSIVYALPFAAGVAMLVGSRGPAIAIYFVTALIVDNATGGSTYRCSARTGSCRTGCSAPTPTTGGRPRMPVRCWSGGQSSRSSPASCG